MEMHQVRYFLAVCETLNFTRAAEQCNVTQPSLTRAIKKLEDELGGPLFHRERHLTNLTELGREMRPYLEETHGAVEAARTRAQDILSLDDAPLHLGIMCTIGPGRLIDLMAKLDKAIPGLELSLYEGTLAQLIERITEGESEIALLASPEDLPERFDFTPLYEERFVVAFTPGHRFESRNRVPMVEMDGEPYLSRINCEHVEALRAQLKDAGAAVQLRYRSEREDWIQSMILAGIGSSMMPEFLPIYPGLPTRVLSEPGMTRAVGLATMAGRRLSPGAAKFMQVCQSHDGFH